MSEQQRLHEIATEGIGLWKESTNTMQTELQRMHDVTSCMKQAGAELLENARSEHKYDHTRYGSADERLDKYHLVESNNYLKATLMDYKHDDLASERRSSTADDTKSEAHRAIVDAGSKKAPKGKQSKAAPESRDLERTDVGSTVVEHEAGEVADPTPVSSVKGNQPSTNTTERKADDLADPIPDQARKPSRFWSWAKDDAEPVEKVRKTECTRQAEIDGNTKAMLGSKDSRTTRATFMKGIKR